MRRLHGRLDRLERQQQQRQQQVASHGTEVTTEQLLDRLDELLASPEQFEKALERLDRLSLSVGPPSGQQCPSATSG